MTPHSQGVTALLSQVKQMTGAMLPLVAERELREARIEGGRIVPATGKGTAENFILLGESVPTKNLGLSLAGVGVGGIVVKTSGNPPRAHGPQGRRGWLTWRCRFQCGRAVP